MSDTSSKSILKGFLTEKKYETEYTSVHYELTDNALILSLSEQGNAGITGYRYGSYTNKDRNNTYQPMRARGMGRDFGLYHQAFLESQAYQDGWGKIEQGLVTSHWYIRPAKVTEPAQEEYARKQAEAVGEVLFGIDGGWAKHIREALYMLIGGFAPFIRVTDGTGQLAALSFRYPSQVQRWLTDENEQHYLGIEFSGSDSHCSYTKLAHELLIYQFRSIGNDFEGTSPMRSVMVYIEAHKLFVRLEALAAEKFGGPFTTVERPEGSYDKADDDRLLDVLDGMLATDNAIILLPGGYKVNVSSPAGQMPSFEAAKRYCDEKIATILSAEGSLVGLNGKGAYNLAEIKDDQQLRSLSYYAKLICSTINDKTSSGGESLIGYIVNRLKDVNGEDLSMRINGRLPCLDWALSPEQDSTDLSTIIGLFEKGVLTKSEEDEDWLREKLKMLPRTKTDKVQSKADILKEEADVLDVLPE